MLFKDINFDVFHPEPLLIIISGPSGVGKDSAVKALREHNFPFHFVITATSRAPRPNETHGVDYFFVSKPEFEEMINKNELLEYSLVYEDYKGVPKAQIRSAMASGRDTVMRVDVQGARKIHKICPEAVLIFLIPNNTEEWYHRLCNRNTETPESLKLRVETAHSEMACISEFDYVVVNAEDQLDKAAENILAIIQAEHHRIPHRKICI
jgi:guanylate kinase